MKLGIRLLLGVFLIVGLAAYFVLSTFSKEVKPGVRQGMEVALVDTANLLAELAAEDLARNTLQEGRLAEAFARYRARDVKASIWGMVKEQTDLRLYVTDGQGIVRYDSEGEAVGRDYSRWNDVMMTLRGQYGVRASRLDSGDARSSSMYVAAPVKWEGRLIGVLTVIAPTASVQPFARRSEHHIRNAGAVLVGTSLLIGLLLTWWLTRDVAKLRTYARSVGTDGRTPLPALGAPELRELGAALEAMRARLDGREYVERYVQNLTHEMKSPLSAIRGAAELLREPLPDEDRERFTVNILEQEQRMRDLVDRMLSIADLQNRQALKNPGPLDFRALVVKVLATREPQAAQRGVTCVLEGEAGGPVTGEAFLLEQAVGNLLDNALSFAPTGTAVQVALRPEGRALHVSVRDRGPGLPDFAREKVFTPFFSLPRPDGKSKGTGLGLCIVREIVLLHGGQVTLDNHPEGGAVARLHLPL
ncbi:two-component system sensor histidine kinase CreC [Mesoterricola silvestris]|uniref:histidine kinase n=1 Tax=Mesoterricola silvestris TaxID=2927979 RepID=A0AA48GXJ2_9BACT|nr:two-component system sensor histidine kinase CreC [Mesoterricola silvestris]BDU73711.1 two-component sensor histidine kinase [Mesoterricola silvestris]